MLSLHCCSATWNTVSNAVGASRQFTATAARARHQRNFLTRACRIFATTSYTRLQIDFATGAKMDVIFVAGQREASASLSCLRKGPDRDDHSMRMRHARVGLKRSMLSDVIRGKDRREEARQESGARF
jgi:hypothetical protein